MKALITIVLLLTLGAVARANLAPVERQTFALSHWLELCMETSDQREPCASGSTLNLSRRAAEYSAADLSRCSSA